MTSQPPIAESIAALGRAVPWGDIRFRVPEHASGWVHCADIVDSADYFNRWRNETAEMFARLQHCSPSRIEESVPAAHVLGWYCDTFAWLGSALFHVARRVPDLGHESIAFHCHAEEGWIDGVALLTSGFLCLPDDSAAEHSHATVLVDESELAAALRSRVVEHAQRFLGTYARDVRLGPRNLWGAVTDSFDTGAWAAGTVLGDAAAGVRDSHLLLPPEQAPFTAASSTYELVDHKERRWFSRRRETCCFAYQLPKPTVCFTCPRIDDGERVARASGWPDP